MNARHTVKTTEWYTPDDIVARVHEVLGPLDFDPASSAAANERIKARFFYTKDIDALEHPWPPGSMFCNPPSVKGKRYSAKFWKKTMEHRDSGKLTHGIFLLYSIEQLATTQAPAVRPMLDFPMVVMRDRIAFLHEDGTPSDSPSHANAVIYIPGTVDERYAFFRVFGELGAYSLGVIP